MSYSEYLAKENLHSSWTRNMFQLITMGVAFLTFFKTNRKLRQYIFVPTTIILVGILVGIYSIYFTYYSGISRETYNSNRHDTWKYISMITIFIFILMALYIVNFIHFN